MLVRSRDLSLYPREGTRVNLQDVILSPGGMEADPTRP
jgi:hypothetical protein